MTTSIKEKETIATARLSDKYKSSWWIKVLQFAGFMILAVLLLEVVFSLSGVGEEVFLEPDAKLGCKHIPNKLVTWRLEGYSHDRFSSIGLRDTEHSVAKPVGVYRIALLGDSATESMQVELEQTFGKVLERLLNDQSGVHRKFEVINFGCSSYSTGQEWLQYRDQVLQYKPDAVVILYNRGDALENLRNATDSHSAELRPYFYLDKGSHLQEDDSVLEANSDKLKANPVLAFLKSDSRLYGVFYQTDLSLSLYDSRYRKIRNWVTNLFNPTNKSKSEPRTNYPIQNEFKVTKALLDTAASETNKRTQRLIVMVFPNIGNDPKQARETKELKQWSEASNVTCLDLTPNVMHCANPMSNFLQYHFSPAGHKLVAQTLFSCFKEQAH